MKHFHSIACISDKTLKSKKALDYLVSNYNFKSLDMHLYENFDLIIVLGGDGFMLRILHKYLHLNVPFYGINTGTEGFLMNHFKEEDLIKRIQTSKSTIIHPLKMIVKLNNGETEEKIAINEISLFRASTQAAKVAVSVNNIIRIPELVCDGVMVSTPAGSTAYHFSVGGSIIPLGSNILALTPISPFRPRRWKGALLPHDAIVRFDVIDSIKRPVNAVADYKEVKDIEFLIVEENKNLEIKLLFDKDHSLEDRIIKEQFFC